jgi:hypothetical protein
LRSLAKGIFATLALIFVSSASFSWFSLIVLVLVLGSLYLSQPRERAHVRVSFWASAILAAIGIGLIGAVPAPVQDTLFRAIILVSFLAAQFALFSLMNLEVQWRAPVYATVNSVLMFGVGVVFFTLNQPAFIDISFIAQIFPIGVFVGTALLVHEALTFTGKGGRLRMWALAAISGFIAVETATLVLFLPLGVVNAAVVLALILTFVRDTLSAHLAGVLSASFVLRELVIFVVILVAVFALSPWSV